MDVAKHITALMQTLNVKFTFNGKVLPYEEVFSTRGLLPGLARRADQLCSLCLGYGIGVTFEEVEKTPLGKEVRFDEVTPMVLRLLCLYDVLNEIVKNAANKEAVALDELMYD